MIRRPILALLVITAALAGCIAPGSTGDGADAAAAPTPVMDPIETDHDHQDPTLHQSQVGFERTAYHPLAADSTRSAGAHAIDAKNGWVFVATYSHHDTEGGLWIFNASDPANPEFTGRWRHVGPMGGDRSMHATEDADFVVIGTEVLTCAGHLNPYGPGLYLLDVRDKSNPQLVDYIPDRGVHSVFIHRIDGEDYVFTMTNADGIYRIDRDGPTGPSLEQVGELAVGHDIFVMDDPLLGKPVLYAADGRGPLNIYDVSDPSDPQLIGVWNIPDRDGKYYVHTAAAEVTPDGKRTVVVTSEDWGDYPSALWVLDATDFEFIETLSQWENPGGHAADMLRFSLHNPRLVDGEIFLAHYHGGVWGIDIQDRSNPVANRHYYPNEDLGLTPQPQISQPVSDELCGPFNLHDIPLVFDVHHYEGHVYTADLHTGLYVLKPTE